MAGDVEQRREIPIERERETERKNLYVYKRKRDIERNSENLKKEKKKIKNISFLIRSIIAFLAFISVEYLLKKIKKWIKDTKMLKVKRENS